MKMKLIIKVWYVHLHYKYFYSLASPELALEKNKINSAILNKGTTNYIISKEANITIDEEYKCTNMGRGYAMFLLEEDQKLCDKISIAIDDIKMIEQLNRRRKLYC